MLITKLENYKDDKGNEIRYSGAPVSDCKITFSDRARNNKIEISDKAKFHSLVIQVLCCNGNLKIGAVSAGRLQIQLGEDCSVIIGDKLTCTSPVSIFTAEGTKCQIGNDVMIGTGVKIKTHDHHPIFDIDTGTRINVSRDIVIGDHVWLCDNSYISKGSCIGRGSVIAFGSFVNKKIPNNCIAAGCPAKVIRKDIAWERPLLNYQEPFYKPNALTIKCSNYWDKTE